MNGKVIHIKTNQQSRCFPTEFAWIPLYSQFVVVWKERRSLIYIYWFYFLNIYCNSAFRMVRGVTSKPRDILPDAWIRTKYKRLIFTCPEWIKLDQRRCTLTPFNRSRLWIVSIGLLRSIRFKLNFMFTIIVM